MKKNTNMKPLLAVVLYGIFMLFAFWSGNVFIDSYDTFIVRFANPDADLVLIFLISLILLLFLYTYFKHTLKTAFQVISAGVQATSRYSRQ